MRIAIAARGLNIRSGGAREYIRNLTLSLLAVDRNNEYFVYYSHPNCIMGLAGDNVHEISLGNWTNVIWDHLILPIQMKRDKIDVALFLKGTVPFVSTVKQVVSVLDLAYFYPGLKAYKWLDTQYFKWLMPYSIKRADAVLAISKNTRLDILKFVPDVEPEKIRITYLSSALNESATDATQSDMSPYSPYIFISSSLTPRKNIERVIVSLYRLKDTIPHKLVLTGGKSWGSNQVETLILKCGLENRIIQLGHVTAGDLVNLYRHADLYVMPSLYEGFSITLLEAMQAGCPVVASNASSHPEIAGDAALYFEPYSIDSITETIQKVLSDSALREDLKQKGSVRARSYSWDKCARETLAVIEDVFNA